MSFLCLPASLPACLPACLSVVSGQYCGGGPPGPIEIILLHLLHEFPACMPVVDTVVDTAVDTAVEVLLQRSLSYTASVVFLSVVD